MNDHGLHLDRRIQEYNHGLQISAPGWEDGPTTRRSWPPCKRMRPISLATAKQAQCGLMIHIVTERATEWFWKGKADDKPVAT